jgi:hypothetical protein
MTPGVGARVSRTTRDGWAPGGHSSRGINPGHGCSLRETEPGTVVEKALEGKRKSQESTDRHGFARKGGIVTRTDSRGEQDSEAGVPVVHR